MQLLPVGRGQAAAVTTAIPAGHECPCLAAKISLSSCLTSTGAVCSGPTTSSATTLHTPSQVCGSPLDQPSICPLLISQPTCWSNHHHLSPASSSLNPLVPFSTQQPVIFLECKSLTTKGKEMQAISCTQVQCPMPPVAKTKRFDNTPCR